MPKVSVIIPNYYHAPYLEQRIDSVLAQTYQDFEVIIMDDCSPDNSRQVIEQYRNHPKVAQIVLNEINSGSTFKQWDKGISLAKGEYIWIAESDDWCETDLLETLIGGINDDDNCVLAYAQSYYVNSQLDIKKVTKANKLAEHLNGLLFIKEYMSNINSVVNASMALFKKNSYFNVPKDFTQFKYTGDWLFWIEIAKQGNVFISGRYLNFFRKHDRDVTGRAFTQGLNFTEAIKILNILKSQDFITEENYQDSLLTRYTAYQNTKQSILPEFRSSVEESFYNPTGKSYEGFLKKKLFRQKTNRRVTGRVSTLIKLIIGS